MKYTIHPYVLTNGRVVDNPVSAVDFAATARLMPKKPKLELSEINFVATCGFIQANHERTGLCECREPASHYVKQHLGGMFLCLEHAAWVRDCQEVQA